MLTSLLSAFDTAGTQVPAKVFNTRSAGIKDLRYGNVVDEDWKDFDPDAFLSDQRGELELIPHVIYCAIASTLARDPAHPLAAVMGDLLVSTHSAQGVHEDSARRIPFHDSRILSGLDHIAASEPSNGIRRDQAWFGRSAPSGPLGPMPIG